ncbi:MAG: electron transfer flavoprotein subunit alpha [Anaerolineaceae bacterium]|nr:electron transfer flavoprotein subunit alpha [Anaerolineaceae bacterium]
MLIINYEDCTGCKLCLNNCPFGAMVYEDGRIQVSELCTLCGACANVCRKGAIHIERKQASTEELAKYKGVFVWVELEEFAAGLKPRKVAYELLGKGRYLADQLHQELVAVVLGDERICDVDTLAHYGADRIIVCQNKLLADYSTDGFTHVMCAVIAQKKPSVVLYGATPHGRDFAPRVAARLKLGLTADCTGLDIDEEGQLVQTRPAFGGNIMASIVTPYSRPQTATVRPNVFAACKPDICREVVVENFPVTLNKAAIRTRVVEKKLLDSENEESIEDAHVIVAGGRGCQKAGNLELLRDIASQLGGVLAGTRAIVEQGWIPHTLQVGQSGTTVGPDLYIAVGVSGAIQHIVGMSSSKTVIAINKDPDAPIFKTADLSVVGDGLEILPILSKMLIEERSAALVGG